MKTKQKEDAGTVRLKRIIKTVFDYIVCVCGYDRSDVDFNINRSNSF